MNREYHAWDSPALGRHMELLVFGRAGEPVITFPTSRGRFYDWEDFGMIDAVRAPLEQGRLQLICLDSIDSESWYNQAVSPAERIARDDRYDDYLIHEVVPFVVSRNQRPMALAGASFGGYHVIDKGLRHPDVFAKLVAMSGAYSADWFLDGFESMGAYLHQPLRYLPQLTDPWFLDRIRSQHILLCVPEHDFLFDQNHALQRLLSDKGLGSVLDVWAGYDHDWPAWRGMLQKHVGW